jgi:hydroxyacyl-ACP dehydratase HTD2-like protein with hotdog domain
MKTTRTIKKNATTSKPPEPTKDHWAQCFLEHAARETAWMGQHAKQRNYASAHDASVRRQVWLHAALLAQEQHK